MQEELKEIEILTFVYKTLKEKAEPRKTNDGVIYEAIDGGIFEIFIHEDDNIEELYIYDKKVPNKTLKLIKEQLKEPAFYCQAGDVCDKQCSTCFNKEL